MFPRHSSEYNPLRMRRLIPILLLFVASQVFAWGAAGHLMSSEAATLGTPNDMPHFFHEAYPKLVWLGPEPDRLKGAGESFDAFNFSNHFLDYEFVAGLELPRDRYQYIALMQSSGRLARLGISNSEAGFLPWRIAELSEELTAEFRMWRRSEPRSAERAALEGEVIRTAGHLGHFIADAANPHHATINYNGWISPNPHGYAIDCGAHDRFERYFVSHSVTTADVAGAMSRPVALGNDYFTIAMDFIKASNAQVETLYRLDRDGTFDLFRPLSAEGKAFTVSRLAAGSSLLRDVWWSAWQNSAKPPRRRGEE